ncbi:4'-phosphopantetheinyl transferase A [Penicillium chermesinum]|uniref:holo-[acyl-carrier-protein] synthase n=1 Tax=Penicillium chermesinum TaxID=63820 RepID=A0A9W9P5R2_9EURO|nr:4'-phosphopantetheinyl transferase A [Penicillium chermesinum]KAJ5238444.1 4'-phosphopantetheinyl transferase A [Penicillium chermesinum]KAJ6164101.1 4'-phosphopantetheinyl transferase A [Penicillium chermesinum]
MAVNEISLEEGLQDTPRAENIDPTLQGLPTTVRWYIDSRDWESHGLDLPLIEALRPDEQKAVRRFHHATDRRMSLSSHLLKYLYIHHACSVPWKDIVLARTPAPEGRPYYKPAAGPGIEFNVTHQAGIIGLAGTLEPSEDQLLRHAAGGILPPRPRLGIDVTCVNEHRRRTLTTMNEYLNFVSMFVDVFSDEELRVMKTPAAALRRARHLGFAKAFPPMYVDESGAPIEKPESVVRFGVRLFYSYWALKEAYLKMTGDALLAPWVRTVEFSNVIPPDPVQPLVAPKPYRPSKDPKYIPQSPKNWGPPFNEVKVSLAGKPLEDIRLQLVSFESDYIVAISAKGLPVGVVPGVVKNVDLHHLPGHITVRSGEETEEWRVPINVKKVLGDVDPWNIPFAIKDPWLPMQEIDIELDVRPCAEGRCVHPESPARVLSGA